MARNGRASRSRPSRAPILDPPLRGEKGEVLGLTAVLEQEQPLVHQRRAFVGRSVLQAEPKRSDR